MTCTEAGGVPINRPGSFLLQSLVFTCLATWALSVAADTGTVRIKPVLFGGVEHFFWEEFDDSGTRLLDESGFRFTLGALTDNLDRSSSGVLYEVVVKGYFGDLKYDGQTQSGQLLETDVEYNGTRLEMNVGGRIARLSGTNDVDLLAGIGLENWTRDIKDGKTQAGAHVLGLKENYHVRFTQVAIGLFNNNHGRDRNLRIGVRKPFRIKEGVSIFDDPLLLEPGPEWSMFVRFRMGLDAWSLPRAALAFYYDSYRFSRSPNETATINGTPVSVHQPKSDMEVLGIQFESSF